MTTTTAPVQPKGLTTRPNTNGAPPDPQSEFRALLTKLRPQIAAALPKQFQDSERWLRLVLTTVRRTPALLSCQRESVLAGVMQAAQLGLELDGLGLAYLIPYGNQCQLIVGWKGLLELARRSNLVANVTAHCVHYGDFFEYELGIDPKLRHIPADVLDMPQYERERAAADGARGEQILETLAGNRPPTLVAAYAVVTMKDGSRVFRVVTRKLVDKIRAMSRGSTHPSSPWVQWEDQMWEKTAVRQVLRFVPLSPEDKTYIERTSEDRVIGGIADIKTLDRIVQEPPIDTTAAPEPVAQPATAAAAPSAPAAPAPEPAKRGRPKKTATPPQGALPDEAISGPPAAAQPAPATPGAAARPNEPPPGPPPPAAAADADDSAPAQAGLFGDGESDDPGPGPE